MKQEKENTIENIAEQIISQREQILDSELKKFLLKHNLPVDKDELSKKGFIVLQDIYTNPNYPTQTNEKFKFTLCRIVDKYELAINYDLNIKSENPY